MTKTTLFKILIQRLIGFHKFIHSETGKKYLALIYPKINRYLPGRAWLEKAYWSFEDPQTGYDNITEANDLKKDPEVDRNDNYVSYQDRERELKDQNLLMTVRKQPQDTCGIETINNMLREQFLAWGIKPEAIPEELIPIQATYDKYKHKNGGTATTIAYPKIIQDGVAIKISDELPEEFQLLFTVNFFEKIEASFAGDIDMYFRWLDKCNKSNNLRMAMSKNNSKAIPTYGIVFPKIKKNLSTTRTGGHITAVNTVFGVTKLGDNRCTRVYESSYPRGKESYKVYTEDVMKIAYNRCMVLKVNDKFIPETTGVQLQEIDKLTLKEQQRVLELLLARIVAQKK